MEEDKADDPEKLPSPKPSQTLSWAMLGFVIGVLFILTLPQRRTEPAVAPPKLAPAPVPRIIAPPRITTVEAVFTEYGHYAVWDDDITEVALWNSQTESYADCFEVLRAGGNVYFRSIPHLTRPLLTHGVPANSPLAFTETAAQRAEWLGQKTEEDWKALGNSVLTGHQ